VVKQSKAKYKIKPAELQDAVLFDISLFERNLREPSPRLRHVFRTPVKPAHIQAAFQERLRKESDATACIHGIGKSQRRLQTCHDALYGLTTRFDELAILFPIERRQMYGNFRGQLKRLTLSGW